MGDQKTFTASEVAKHTDSKSCWFIIEGKVYAVEKFLSEHPGGEDVLLETAGRDATREFEDVGHSKSAREQLEEFYVGDLRAMTAEELEELKKAKNEQVATHGRSSWTAARTGGAFGTGATRGSGFGGMLKRMALPILLAVLVYLVRKYTASDKERL